MDALGPRLRIPLVRSAYDPDPMGEGGGTEVTRLRVFPHGGSWKDAGVVTMAMGLNSPILVVTQAQPSADSSTLRPRIVSGSAVIAGLQLKSGSVLLRLYEATGRSENVVIGGLIPSSSAAVCDLLGDPQRQLYADDKGRLALRLRGFEIVTLRLARDRTTDS